MALARLHTWAANEVLTASDLNGEFNNILNNPTALITPLSANLALGAFSLTGLGAGSASTPSLSFDSDSDTGIYRSAADSVDLTARGGRVLQASGFADGVNFVRISNAASGQGSPTIEAAGTDTNVGLRLVAKGSGYVEATSFRFGVFTATQTADHDGRTYWHKTEGVLHIVSGTLMGRVPALTGIKHGDLIIASGSDGATTYARLGVGDSGQTLTVTAGLPAWGSAGVFTSSFTSGTLTVGSASAFSVAHGLGAIPTLVQLRLQNRTGEHGYSTGDEVVVSGTISEANSSDTGASVACDATNVYVMTGTNISLFNRGTAAGTGAITLGSWRWVVRAWV